MAEDQIAKKHLTKISGMGVDGYVYKYICEWMCIFFDHIWLREDSLIPNFQDQTPNYFFHSVNMIIQTNKASELSILFRHFNV